VAVVFAAFVVFFVCYLRRCCILHFPNRHVAFPGRNKEWRHIFRWFFAISTIVCRLLLPALIVSLASLLQTSFHVSERSSRSYCWRVWKGFITKCIIQPNSPLLQVFIARTCSVYCLLRSEKYEFCSVLLFVREVGGCIAAPRPSGYLPKRTSEQSVAVSFVQKSLWLIRKFDSLQAVAKLRKATISVCPSVCMEHLSSHWTDRMKFYILIFFEKSVEKNV
jgi:hypothetical protein